jgi:hypothetical protein
MPNGMIGKSLAGDPIGPNCYACSRQQLKSGWLSAYSPVLMAIPELTSGTLFITIEQYPDN